MPQVKVDRDGSGLRLDRFLKKILPGMPSGHIFKLLRTRKVRVNGKRAQATLRLAEGDEVLVHMSAEQFTSDAKRPVRRALGIDFSIVYEDAHLLVVTKPPFLAVHPGAGHSENSLIDQVHAYLEVQDRPAAFRPALAHRLDRDTSGLVMIGKDAETLRSLARGLQQGKIAKKYLALAKGVPSPAKGVWSLQVQRRDLPGSGPKQPSGRGRQDAEGVTGYRVAATRKLALGQREQITLSLLVLKLQTGRTHQIRSHLVQAGHPLAGDRRYGDRELNRLLATRFGLRRQFLHAYRLNLTHPIRGTRLDLSSPYPEDLLPLVEQLGLGVPAY